jgi:ribosome-associated translation inhibitor RaiA
MKLTLEHFSIRSTNALDSWVENRIFSLQPRLQIDEANIRLEHRRETSPAYRVQVHLVTPGPDVFAEGRDHTLRAAFDKVMVDLQGKVTERSLRRLERQRSNLPGPGGKSRTGRKGHARR